MEERFRFVPRIRGCAAILFLAVFVLFANPNKSVTTRISNSVEAFSVTPKNLPPFAIGKSVVVSPTILFPDTGNNNNKNNNKKRSGRMSSYLSATSGNNNNNDINNTKKEPNNRDSSSRPPPVRNIVIAGGGIVGTSVAYYLVEDHFKNNDSTSTISLTLVDPTGSVGSCASGKAGGFLARDWRNGTPLEELQKKGFALHEILANALGRERVDYRRLTCAAVAVDETESNSESKTDTDSGNQNNPQSQRLPNKPPSKKLMDLEWVDPDVVLWENNNNNNNNNNDESVTPGVYPMGDEETIAQVHPRKLCEAMWESITKGNHQGVSGVELIGSRIVRARTKTTKEGGDATRSVESVELENGRILESDVLVVACGPWTYEANDWFYEDPAFDDDDDKKEDNKPLALLPQITAVKCHSILVPSARGKPNTQAVFFDSNGAIGEEGDLEVYPRPDGDSYVNGFANEEGICTEAPGKEEVEQDKIALLREAMEFVENTQGFSGKISDDNHNNDDDDRSAAPPRDHTQQVCYWPETPSGFPIIGKIPRIDGAYVAAGHSVWGILQGPPTGKGLAELIVKGRYESIDLYPFGLE